MGEKQVRGCAFTGHRVIPGKDLTPLVALLRMTIACVWETGIRDFYAGGAMGFDRLAAGEVLRFRAEHPDVRLHLILPCAGQESGWCAAEQRAYRAQMAAADEVTVLSGRYYDGCMRARNSALVSHASVLIAYVTGQRSGSAQTLRLAQAQGVRVINLAERLSLAELIR